MLILILILMLMLLLMLLLQVKQEIERRLQEKEEEFEATKKNYQRTIDSLQVSLLLLNSIKPFLFLLKSSRNGL